MTKNIMKFDWLTTLAGACAIVIIGAFILAICVGGYDQHEEIIDGCEYISSPVYGGRSLTHKGNCTNAVHQTR